MKSNVNETYIANMCMYFHLLSDGEKINEILKIREYTSDKSRYSYHLSNQIKVIGKAINALNKR